MCKFIFYILKEGPSRRGKAVYKFDIIYFEGRSRREQVGGTVEPYTM